MKSQKSDRPLHTSPLSRRAVLRSAAAIGLAAISGPFTTDAADDATSATVQLKGGHLSGAKSDGIFSFKGVRYGEDTGPSRFRPAQPAKAWSGVRKALEFGNQCPQPKIAPAQAAAYYPEWQIETPASEDCLFLNLWTPGLSDGRKRPVMVWLHGGGYAYGSPNAGAYDGARLARRGDVVLVAVTHRLNLFGYLYLADLLGPEFADSGNVGTLDTVLALEWVRDNIGAFGGNPQNVMIFGQSGGGGKVATLMSMTRAKGLFHRAAIQSGGGRSLKPEDATQSALKFLSSLGVSRDNAKELLTRPAADLIAALPGAGAMSPMGPVADGRSLPTYSANPLTPAVSIDVPLLVGNVASEWTKMLGLGDESLFHLNWADLETHLTQHFSRSITGTAPMDAERIRLVIAAARQQNPDASPTQLFFDITTYGDFTRTATRIAELRTPSGRTNTYVYQLRWGPSVDDGKWGSTHGTDLPLIFDNVARMPKFMGPETRDSRILTEQMSGAWLAFARTGNPGRAPIPDWPAYDLAKRPTMLFDVKSHVEDDFQQYLRLMFA